MIVYPSFKEISDNYDTLFVDVYGVFWNGTDFTPGAKETLVDEVRKGKRVCILSNTSSTDPVSITKGLKKGVHYTDVISSGMVVHGLLKRNALPVFGNKIYILGHSKFDLTTGTGFQLVDTPKEADMVYFGTPRIEDLNQYRQYKELLIKTSSDLYDIITPEPFLEELKYLAGLNLPVISTNPDLFAMEMGHWVIRQGTLVEIYQQLGGIVYEYGKPHKNIFDYAFRQLNITPSKRVAMIGDTYRTDIKGAKNAGISPVWCLDYGVAKYELSKGKTLEEQAGGSLEEMIFIHHL